MARRVSVRAGKPLDEGCRMIPALPILDVIAGVFTGLLTVALCYLIVLGTDRRRE